MGPKRVLVPVSPQKSGKRARRGCVSKREAEVEIAPAKQPKRGKGGKIGTVRKGWVWDSGESDDLQVPVCVGSRTYYHHILYYSDGQVPLRIAVEDVVATQVDKSDEETRELKLEYWVGQVGALFEENGEPRFVLKFMDMESQWRYMNWDDSRLLKTFGHTFRKHEVLETDVCETNSVEIILKRMYWAENSLEAANGPIGDTVFSDRLVVRCGSDGIRRGDLSDSLWPAPAGRRRNRLLIHCPDARYSLQSGRCIAKVSTPSDDPVYSQAIEALKLSVLPENLPCRETETLAIREFIKTAVKSTGQCGNVLYISGVPGAGKTASVLSVVAAAKRDKQIPEFQFIHINSMKLNKPTDIFRYVRVHVCV